MKLKHRYKEIKEGLDETLDFNDQRLAQFIKEEQIVCYQEKIYLLIDLI